MYEPYIVVSYNNINVCSIWEHISSLIQMVQKLKPSNVITDKLTELPKGTLKQLFGKNITFEDEPIMIET